MSTFQRALSSVPHYRIAFSTLLPWPAQFLNEDVEAWIDELWVIVACNGVNVGGNLLKLLGTLLIGREKSTYLLTLKSKAGCSFDEVKTVFFAQFAKEIDREQALEKFHSAKWE